MNIFKYFQSRIKRLNLCIEKNSENRYMTKLVLITLLYRQECNFFLIRETSLNLILGLYQILQFVSNPGRGVIIQSDLNKALYGHSFRNITGITKKNCLERCLADCSCLSFQLCHGIGVPVSCQLCSSNKYLKRQAMRECKACTSFNFGNLYEVN